MQDQRVKRYPAFGIMTAGNSSAFLLGRSEEDGQRNILLAVKVEQSGGVVMTENPFFSLGCEILMGHGWDIDRIQVFAMGELSDV